MKRKGARDCDAEGNECIASKNEAVLSSNYLDGDIAQLTKLKSRPHKRFGKTNGRVSSLKMLFGRESNCSGRGNFSSADACHVLSRYLPINGPSNIEKLQSHAYVSQFSHDGSLFVAAFQRCHIRVYDVDRGWNLQKKILAQRIRWTITDTCLSPDQRHLVYASISPMVHVVNVGSGTTVSEANVTEIHEGLNFRNDDEDNRAIFSVKFSTDGRELVGGSANSSIYVYDLEANRCSLKIPAHEDDVNTVCFADDTGHLIYSGSDDNLCKVWDRRCFISKGQASGVLMGHMEGITFIDSRRDGRYLISNGKDQTIKLWDIRKMSTNVTYNSRLRDSNWDYRLMEYPAHARTLKHPCDQSLATYSGHSVLCTLIRCYFSPTYSTGQKYIYTGSGDGSVYIYDLVTGAQVAKLDHHKAPVRDCSWHPVYPVLVSSSWDGVIAKWEFPGSGETPAPVRRKFRRRR